MNLYKVRTRLLRIYYIIQGKAQPLWTRFYEGCRLEEIGDFFLFLLHQYKAKQFNPKYVKENVRTLFRQEGRIWVGATSQGELIPLTKQGNRALFLLKNALLFGALQSRVKKVVFYTFLTLTIEIHNPFDQKILPYYLDTKIAFIKRLLDQLKTINGKMWNPAVILLNIEVFRRNSILQSHIIKQMHRAVKKAEKPHIIERAEEGLKKRAPSCFVNKRRFWSLLDEGSQSGNFRLIQTI